MKKRPSIYSRPDKPLFTATHRRERFASVGAAQMAEPVVVDKTTECHVTPGDVAARMVGYLGPVGDYLTCEPSAGTGQLVRALLASGHSRNELTMIERHRTLALALEKLGTCINRCFLEYAEEAKGKIEFPRIIMNPPFRDVRKHIAAALSLLGRGGHGEPATLVALVPITFEHPEAETLETLPNDTFATAKVNTKIIRIRR
ncbi:methyltransferase type 11 (plasmid) [Agrobacterium sp. rho-13.3]|uniref:methyltransferase type 11 n=1 Tax=Agrobacterium sp. rho-13.3 TaxID=3072980 RepID=UPI002A162DFB|nr:methyltransferase type 11 [Agrobacterium sp. rho-13.3]MDX8311538.1 methyltransferase type 11 [Agrobacterium sp. rho-13.3]